MKKALKDLAAGKWRLHYPGGVGEDFVVES
jgi:hypothetical protein